MPQSYRQSSKRRNITLNDIYKMSEQEAINFIANARWGSKSKQVCPNCWVFDRHYYKKGRKQWFCKHCEHTFSITSSTVFANRKCSVKKILKLLFIFCNSAKGTSANESIGYLGLSHKSIWLSNHKIREGLLRSRDLSKLNGMVHVDGAYFGGKRRHGRIRNYKIAHKHFEARIASKGKNKLPKNAIQRRNAYIKWKNRRVVMVFREIDPTKGIGAVKTRVTVVRNESEDSVKQHTDRFIKAGSTVWTDEHKAYNHLSKQHKHETVEHSKEFMTKDGVHNNHAESFFSRLRRSEYGVFHGMRPQYMIDYANEMSWREDMRRKSLLEQLTDLIIRVFSVGESIWWCGYHQGHRRNDEMLNF